MYFPKKIEDIFSKIFKSPTRKELMILAIIVVITVSSSLNQKGIASSQTTQGQIYILDHTRSRLTVAYGAFIELTATNNTAEIEEKIVLEELENLLNPLRTELGSTRICQTAQSILAEFQNLLKCQLQPVKEKP